MPVIWLVVVIVFIALFGAIVGVFTSENVPKILKYAFDIEDKQEIIKLLGWGLGLVFAAANAIAIHGRLKAQDKNNTLIEKGHIQDRIKAATEHLGNDRAGMRIATYYEFYQLAQDNPKLRKNIFEILCAHLRQITNASGYKEKHKDKNGNEVSGFGWDYPTEGVQTLLDILFKPKDEYIFQGLIANLRRIYLISGDLRGAKLLDADFTDAWLCNTDFSNAQLQGACFSKVKMHKAKLCNANMQGTCLENTILHAADLYNADLRGAKLINIHLQAADTKNILVGGSSQDVQYDSFENMIKNQIGKVGNIGDSIINGGINYPDPDGHYIGDITPSAILPYAETEYYSIQMDGQINPDDSVPSATMLTKEECQKHNIFLTPYTEEEAKKWIMEYNNAKGIK